MKIAFVGKGGSGKSTVAALFIDFLLRTQMSVLAIDADINIHLPSLMGLPLSEGKALSREENSLLIRKYLVGTNKRIESLDHMIRTTPPGEGSNLLVLEKNNSILQSLATPMPPSGYLMHVGTYTQEDIGGSCYHNSLVIFENILSHFVLADNEWLVADMVAGVDTFANSLFAQFDCLFIVVEPTKESVGVFLDYEKLGRAAGIAGDIYAIGNKVEDDGDEGFLKEALGGKLTAILPYDKEIKKLRQKDLPIVGRGDVYDGEFNKIKRLALRHIVDDKERLARLYNLHRQNARLGYIVRRLGDVSGQIDPRFAYPPRSVRSRR